MKMISVAMMVAAVMTFGGLSVKAQSACGCKQCKITSKSAKKSSCKCSNASCAKCAKKKQTLCPVTGKKINKKFYVDVKGKRIYVCCSDCVAKVKANPDKYIKKLKKAGVAVEVLKHPQTNCPVMRGNKINKSLYVDADGKRIYVCCGGCISKVKANPQKYIKLLESQGVVLEKTPKK